MNNEIKEILDKLKDGNWYDELDLTGTMWIELKWEETHLLLDYITNLQQENERLKQVMLVKQYYSETLPEGTEFVVLTKENYDRQQKDIQLELIDYKSRCEKAVEYIKKHQYKWYDLNGEEYIEPREFDKNVDASILLNILQNGSEDK